MPKTKGTETVEPGPYGEWGPPDLLTGKERRTRRLKEPEGRLFVERMLASSDLFAVCYSILKSFARNTYFRYPDGYENSMDLFRDMFVFSVTKAATVYDPKKSNRDGEQEWEKFVSFVLVTTRHALLAYRRYLAAGRLLGGKDSPRVVTGWRDVDPDNWLTNASRVCRRSEDTGRVQDPDAVSSLVARIRTKLKSDPSLSAARRQTLLASLSMLEEWTMTSVTLRELAGRSGVSRQRANQKIRNLLDYIRETFDSDLIPL